MEIKVGEYVRTRQGFIAKVKQITEELILFDNVIYEDWEEDWCLHLTNKYGKKNQSEEILKHSKNIIDLIEVGDYVNNCKVLGRDKNSILLLTDNAQTYLQSIFEDKDIKTVLTHEQFERNAYRLEEKYDKKCN